MPVNLACEAIVQLLELLPPVELLEYVPNEANTATRVLPPEKSTFSFTVSTPSKSV